MLLWVEKTLQKYLNKTKGIKGTYSKSEFDQIKL